MFIEAKWVYNYLVGKSKEDKDFKITDATMYKELYSIYHLDKDNNKIDVTIKNLGSSIIQGIIDKIKFSITSLSKLKGKGNKIGGLKFKREYNSLFLKQYGISHKISDSNHIKIQGIKKPLRICGLKQISKYNDIDFTTAELYTDGYDYFIKIICYISKDEINSKKVSNNKNDILGIDFGCATTVTTSNGDKYDFSFEESDRIKMLQHRLAGQVKMSNNWKKTKYLIRKEWRKIKNRKEDAANKLVHQLCTENNIIVTQNDDLTEWHKKQENVNTSNTVQHTILGRLKYKMKHKDNIIFLNKWIPTSKLCTNCGNIYKDLSLANRTYICPICGNTEDRDVHAAKNMVWLYKKDIKTSKELAGVLRASF
jgi:putative transposase